MTQPNAIAFLSALLKDNPLYTIFGWPICGVTSSVAPCRSDEPVNIADRSLLPGVRWRRETSPSASSRSGVSPSKAAISFGYPILDGDGRVQAVVAAGMDLSWLNQLMADAELPEGALLLVIDRNGTILYGYPIPEAWIGQSD